MGKASFIIQRLLDRLRLDKSSGKQCFKNHIPGEEVVTCSLEIREKKMSFTDKTVLFLRRWTIESTSARA